MNSDSSVHKIIKKIGNRYYCCAQKKRNAIDDSSAVLWHLTQCATSTRKRTASYSDILHLKFLVLVKKAVFPHNLFDSSNEQKQQQGSNNNRQQQAATATGSSRATGSRNQKKLIFIIFIISSS